MKMKNLLTTRPFIAVTLLLTLGGAGGTSQALAAEQKTPTVTSLFRVEGMTCGGCEAGVKMKVKKLAGVATVEASHKEKRARVTYDPKRVTPQRIIKAIEELGYAAELLKERTGAGTEKPRGGPDDAGLRARF